MSPVADQERTERLAEQHRREIVDAAERLVKGNGLHQLKLRDIAKESGKSLGNLYNYFQNKEAIIEALVEREKSRFLEHVVALIHQDPSCSMDNVPRELLEARVICIRTFFESLRGAVAFYPDVNREMLKQVTIERLLLIWMWERSKALGMSLEAFEKSMAIK